MELQPLFFPRIFMPLSHLLFIMSLITILFRARSRTPKYLPPGPWMLPFLGSLHHLVGSDQPYITLRKLAQKHGPLMHLKLGERSTIVVSSPEVAKQVLKTHDVVFAQRPNLLSADIMLYNSSEIVFSPYGLYWRHLKKLCTHQFFSVKQVRSYHSIREAEAGKFVRDISTNIGRAINLSEKIFAMTFAIVTRSAFGDACKDQEAFISVVKEMVNTVRGFSVSDSFPSQKWLHALTGERRRFEELHRKCDALLQKFVDKGVSRSTEEDEAESLLYDLLKLRDQSGPQEPPFTMSNAKSVILVNQACMFHV